MDKKTRENKGAADRATALTALASTEKKAGAPCLGEGQLAEMLAGRLAGKERDHCLAHLAQCQSCYGLWRDLGLDEGRRAKKVIRGPWLRKHSWGLAAAGSFAAAAASLLLFLKLAPLPELDRQPLPVHREHRALEAPPEPLAPERKGKVSPKQTPAADMEVSRPEFDRQPPPVLQEEGLQEAPAAPVAPERKARLKANQVPAAEMEVSRQAPLKKKEELAERLELARRTARPAESARSRFDAESFGELEPEAPAVAAVVAGKEEMVDINNVVTITLKKVAHLQAGEALVLETYKRDRSLTLIPQAGDRVQVLEQGFERQEFEVERGKLKKLLKGLLKKEFPRSNKVRISIRPAD